MMQLAADTGVGRENFYKALSGDGNPNFENILKPRARLARSSTSGVWRRKPTRFPRPPRAGFLRPPLQVFVMEATWQPPAKNRTEQRASK